MIETNPAEELAYYLTCTKKSSFHFGEIGLGIFKLLDSLKEKGLVVQLDDTTGNLKLFTKEECLKAGIEFEHKICSGQGMV